MFMTTPQKRKKAKAKKRLTTDEIARKVFPEKVIERLKRVANQKPKRSKKPSS